MPMSFHWAIRFAFAAVAMVLGGISLAKQKKGAGMAIAGLILGGIGLLGAMGSQL